MRTSTAKVPLLNTSLWSAPRSIPLLSPKWGLQNNISCPTPLCRNTSTVNNNSNVHPGVAAWQRRQTELLQRRRKVLGLYKSIIRAGLNWESETEKQYILDEARDLFGKNKNLSDTEEINEKIFEAESRLELGIHYKIPYPRLYNAPPETSPDQLPERQIKPLYMASYDKKT